MENRSIGRAIVALGIVLLIVGIILCLIPNSLNFVIITYTTYPYMGLGMVLIISGIIAIVIGGVIMTRTNVFPYQPQQFNPYYQQPQIYPATPPAQPMLCPNCGNPKGAGGFCQFCGAKFG